MPFDITSTTTSPDPRYKRGPMKIWYMRPSFFRNGLMGFDFLRANDLLPQPNYVGNVERTHVCIGSISVDDPEDAYELMQGERWSPHGEARSLIEAHGLKHTSMSKGDIVQKDNAFWIVDAVGFKRLANLNDNQ